MTDIIFNEEISDELYLAALNLSFGNWGDEEMYRWVFERQCGSYPPERMMILDGDTPLAGSGISYRKVRLARSGVVDVGIMTGSWTMPEARGRGLFSQIIEESRRRSAERNCGLLLAYVTHDNPSRRALERAGSAMFPTWYIFGDGTKGDHFLDIPRFQRSEISCHSQFYYPTQEAFDTQFYGRPGDVRSISVTSGRSIIEFHEQTARVLSFRATEDRLQTLMDLQGAAGQANMGIFAFSTVEGVPLGLEGKPGFLTALVADRSALETAIGSTIEPSSRCLANPTHPSFIGPWFVESGDRM